MALKGSELVTADCVKALHEYNEETYVKADGSVPMTGSLQLHDGYAITGASSTRAAINSYPDNTNQNKYRGFAVLNHTNVDDKSDAFVVAENNGSGESIYKLYGEHNNNFNDTIWTGNGTDNGYGFISSNKSLFQIGITNEKKDVTKNRNLEIDNSSYSPSISNALKLFDSDGTTTNVYKIYGEHNKPTASDVKAIPETDRELLVKSIGNNKDFSEIRDNGSFVQRIVGGVSEEISAKYPELYGTHAAFRSYKNGCYWMHFYMTHNNFYVQHTSDANDITFAGWRKIGTVDSSGSYLPLDGSTPMTGDYIMMNNGWGLFESNNIGSSVFANNTQTTANFANARGITIMNGSSNIKTAFQIRDKVNEATAVYNVFGEHNVTCGTTDIEAGSSLTGIYEVYQ
jgi:hypothetical protein